MNKRMCVKTIFTFLVLYRNACNKSNKELEKDSSLLSGMMNNNLLIDSARPKVLLGEESERHSEDKLCASQKYLYNISGKHF